MGKERGSRVKRGREGRKEVEGGECDRVGKRGRGGTGRRHPQVIAYTPPPGYEMLDKTLVWPLLKGNLVYPMMSTAAANSSLLRMSKLMPQLMSSDAMICTELRL